MWYLKLCATIFMLYAKNEKSQDQKSLRFSGVRNKLYMCGIFFQ